MSKTLDQIIQEMHSIIEEARILKVRQRSFEELVVKSVTEISEVKQKMLDISTRMSENIQPTITSLIQITNQILSLHNQITDQTTQQEAQNIQNQILTLSNEYFEIRQTFMADNLPANFMNEIILPLKRSLPKLTKYVRTPSLSLLNNKKAELN